MNGTGTGLASQVSVNSVSSLGAQHHALHHPERSSVFFTIDPDLR